MDLAAWLRSLGLEQYEATFRDNAITEKLLPSLTAEDLKDLGVSVVGHRRALLNAIADLRSDRNAHRRSAGSFGDAYCTAKRTRRRTPSSNGHVLRPRRLYGAIGNSSQGRH